LAGGFIADRFLTGIRPQEYFFHCMAGREGLIDTAVKTSRSGYLQRCLVKGLEELRVNYDHTVRDADGVVVEFLYGDDGVDPMHAKYLDGAAPQMTSLARNHAALLSKYGVDAEFFQRTGMTLGPANAYHQRVAAAKKHGQAAQAIEVGSCVEARRLKHGRTEWVSSSWREGWHKATVLKVHEAKGSKGPTYDVQYEDQSVAKKVPLLASVPQQAGSAAVSGVADKKVPAIRTSMPSPFTSTVHMGCTLGAVSERFQEAIQAYVETDPDRLILQPPPVADDDNDKKKKKRAKQQGPLAHTGVVSKASFQLLLWLKYMRSLAAPGEAVGSIAGQSIGEPSTQMTLNTFHLAGHGGANVTLGIPRLREILMTASQNIKTPSMTIKLKPGVSKQEASRLASRLRMLQLAELIHHKHGVMVTERLRKLGPRPWERLYQIRLQMYDEDVIQQVFGVDYEELMQVVKAKFLRMLLMMLSKEARREVQMGGVIGGAGKKGSRGKKGKEDGEDDEAGPMNIEDEAEADLDVSTHLSYA
jgi:DNA-directed RNA polymerase I subunit RPA1